MIQVPGSVGSIAGVATVGDGVAVGVGVAEAGVGVWLGVGVPLDTGLGSRIPVPNA
ncbi:hypothetical protein [Agreia sp. COWG]|uniref:hypothetical protein n=1 Tax=Agreia sp. COWG TaxID=2773266 RepID=UPI001925201F|nr:hypothetical protein [Agreia sp. COWG]